MMPPGDNPTAAPSSQEDWDELLSAYLDDELPPEERAAVDEHLAGNADARRLLAELRALTETLHQVPHEAVPRSMTDAVLQAAEQRMLSIDPARDQQHGDARGGPSGRSSLPIGRSRRGWFWAVAAIAAAIVLMVSQREDPAPTLAKSDAEAAPERREPAEMHATDEVADGPAEADRGHYASSAEPVPADAFPDAQPAPTSESAVGDLALNSNFDGARTDDAQPATGPPGTPMPSSAATRSTPTPGPPARGAETSGLAGEFGGGRGGYGGVIGEAAAGVADNPLVVRFDLRPEAFANRFMDTVLTNNGIAVEPTPVSLGRRAAETETEGATIDRPPRGRLQARDIMLVDAPSPQIIEVVSQLNRDYVNVFGIQIEQAPAKQQAKTYNFLQEEVARQQQVADRLGPLSRANVGPQQAANTPAMQQQIARRDFEPATAKPLAKKSRVQEREPRGVAIRIEPEEKLAVDTTDLFAQINRYAVEKLSGVNREAGRGSAIPDTVPVVFFMQPSANPVGAEPAAPRQ
ncbi:hypothetical protein Pla123a_14090 [Posidoniimonas polymericola]|uniref:Putative zinc-finger domain-containing protein n=1 Tax=Posidoniimonas polymericola TaxID=2528002 RepID=A0A5C5YS09_9BACT|nr:zf-HC2 domain-containing protein [Posidoniimonas polymericola]TWT77613.1 hypothetical protein Pla123a_14090 [Posidoniimonas polymericola]